MRTALLVTCSNYAEVDSFEKRGNKMRMMKAAGAADEREGCERGDAGTCK
jgi:hypothetical protein